MEIAVMYSDSSDLTVIEKIEKYSGFYERKYGIKPEVCHVHPSLFESLERDEREELGVQLVSDDLILKNNFWIGVEEGTFKFYSELKSEKYIEEQEVVFFKKNIKNSYVG